MSIQRRIIREMKQYEDRLGYLVGGKRAPHTEKPRMAVAGNNPSRNKRTKQHQHSQEQLVKLARVVVACLITAAGGGHKAQPVAVDRSPALKLDAYHYRIYSRGTVITAPREALPAKAPRKGKSHKASESRHQRIVRQARKQAVAA